MVQPLWSALERTLGPFLAEGALLCVSGGPDSRTLLEVCARWPHRFAGALAVASVDHGTRAEARAEADAVCARAHALGFEGVRLSVRAAGGDEGALRDARYAALVHCARARGLHSLVVAHHRGDVAEGRLLSLRGEGGGPLAPLSSVLGLRVVRPFLSLPRAALASARFALGVDGVFEDAERRSARARLRGDARGDGAAASLTSLPSLPSPSVIEERAALDAARRLEDEQTLAPLAAELVDTSLRDGVFVRVGPPALLRRALKRALATLAPAADVRSAGPALDRLLALVAAGRAGVIHLPGDVEGAVVVGGVRLRGRALAGRPVPAYAAWDVSKDAVEGTEDS